MSAEVSAFYQYARGAWQRFLNDPARAQASIAGNRGYSRSGRRLRRRSRIIAVRRRRGYVSHHRKATAPTLSEQRDFSHALAVEVRN